MKNEGIWVEFGTKNTKNRGFGGSMSQILRIFVDQLCLLTIKRK